ncbi:MAG TPA: thioredoxin family protein [Bryobacteraceae bacterium]|nr:thioredoxin family protein [Bryobacteraceae bacterium]
MEHHPAVSRAVSREEWLAARKALLIKEKEATRLRDQLNAERMALPWVKIEKEYTFDSPQGKTTLADLFAGRSQLVIYHFMFAPGWAAGCPGCSHMSDHLDGPLTHLEHHDVSLAVVSRAPIVDIEAYKKRMGWRFPWVSSFGTGFNYDFQVTLPKEDIASGKAVYNFANVPAQADAKDIEAHGISAFYKDQSGQVFHTYSTYARGVEEWVGTLMILDRTPKGRNEKSAGDFVRRHDEYDKAATAR